MRCRLVQTGCLLAVVLAGSACTAARIVGIVVVLALVGWRAWRRREA